METKNKSGFNAGIIGVLLILGFANAVMYCFPYVRYVFFDQQIEAMHITATQSGLLMTIYSAAMMLSFIPGGLLVDRFSVKKCLLYSIMGSFLVIVVYALTMNFAVACVLWFIVGFTTNFVFWCGITKAVGMVGSEEQQGTCYGIYYASSGIFSAILNAVCLWAAGFSADATTSFMIGMWVMAGSTLLTAALVFLFFKERAVSGEKSEEDTFQWKYVGVVLKNPMTWLISLMVFCANGLYTSVSYFSPYLTDVLGVPLVESSLLSIVRSNLMNLLCPIGGIIIDRVFKSANKWYITGFAITTAIYAGVMVMPDTIHPGAATFISLLPSAIAMMLYGVIWSGLKECRFKAAYLGTVIGIGSVLGYLPDFFYHTMFGYWMDHYGTSSYKMIFGFLMATAVIGGVTAVIIRVMIQRNIQEKRA